MRGPRGLNGPFGTWTPIGSLGLSQYTSISLPFQTVFNGGWSSMSLYNEKGLFFYESVVILNRGHGVLVGMGVKLRGPIMHTNHGHGPGLSVSFVFRLVNLKTFRC